MALRLESLWLQMRDGARIAVDLVLPTAVPAEASLGSVLIPAREWRSVGGGGLGPERAESLSQQRVPPGPESTLVEAFVSAGLAVVVCDVRGTGASDGSWLMPWSEDEIADGAEVVDWMLRQHWSNGRLATAGSRYGAAWALLIAGAHHGVRAVAAAAIDADLYADVAFPGGLRNAAALDRWSARLAASDANRPPGWPAFLGALAAILSTVQHGGTPLAVVHDQKPTPRRNVRRRVCVRRGLSGRGMHAPDSERRMANAGRADAGLTAAPSSTGGPRRCH
jgi:predicted acyl esterase